VFGGGTQTGSRTVRNAIEGIIKEDDIEGVIIRINSPGGSAIASEVMWQGIERLREHKPVWVSVGNMAASGGYYVLSGGDKVYVNPSSVVGSIGVVGGKYALGDVYDKLKINVVERSRGPVSGLMSSSSPWNERQVGLIREEMTEVYDLFTSRVEAGRRGIDLDQTAEGRLFLGERAIELKMADEIGGIDDAINDLADELDLVDYDVVHYPEPPSFDQVLREMLGGFMKAPSASINPIEATLRSVLGDDRYAAIVDQLNAMMLLRDEKVLLVSPHVFIVR
jgi:protease-4